MVMNMIRRLFFGYTEADMEMLEVKIASGLDPKDVNLTRGERNALAAMPATRIIELCNKEPLPWL